MRVICERYKNCTVSSCAYKEFHNWNEKILSKNNYCVSIRTEIIFISLSDIRKKKLEKLNESRL